MRTAWRIVTVLMLVGGLSGCGALSGIFASDDGGPRPAELIDFDSELRIKPVWSTRIGKGVGENYIKLQPAVDDGKVFAVDINGQLVALSAETGTRLWRVQLKEEISGGVGAGFGYLFLGTKEGKVMALSQIDGAIVWQHHVSSEILSAPTSNGDIVVVQTLDEKVYGLDHDTGEQEWFYESVLPTLTLRGTSSPVLAGNMALVGLASGKVVALHTDSGRVLWEHRIALPQGRSELERMTDIDGDLLQQGGMLYATSFQGKVTAIEISTARIRWQKDISSFLGPDEGFGNLYLVDTNDHLYALDINSGDIVWRQNNLFLRQLTPPVTFGNYLVVGDYAGYLHVVSQLDGHFMGRKKIDGDGIRSTMVAQGDRLYVYGNSGKVIALEIIEK